MPFLYAPSFNSRETYTIRTLSSVVIRGPWRSISVILAKTDYAIIFIKIHYTYLTAPMDIIFVIYTNNSVKNYNLYINLHFRIIRVHRGQL